MIAKVKITEVCAETIWSKPIPKGIVGAQVELEYDASWAGLQKTVVFMGAVSRDVLDSTGVVRIPQEVVADSGCSLFVGVYGTNADDIIAIPTLWASLGIVRESADPSGDPSTAPQLPIWAQMQAEIEGLKKICNGGGAIIAKGDGDSIVITTSMTVRGDGDAIILGG